MGVSTGTCFSRNTASEQGPTWAGWAHTPSQALQAGPDSQVGEGGRSPHPQVPVPEQGPDASSVGDRHENQSHSGL